MVHQRVEYRKPSFGERIGNAAIAGSQQAAESIPAYMMAQEEKKIAKEKMDKENAAAKKLGIDLTDISDPKIREKFAELGLKSKYEKEELALKDTQRKNLINEIKNRFRGNAGFDLTDEQSNIVADQLMSGQNAPQGQNQSQGMQGQERQNQPREEEDPFLEAELYAAAGEKVLSDVSRDKAKTSLKAKDKQLERNEKKFQSDREFNTKRSDPVLKENDEFRKILPALRQNSRLIKDAAPEVTTQDYIADLLNYEPLRTAKGAQLKTAAKDALLKDIQILGRQPNQWIEQQIDSAMVKLGKSPEANLTIAEAKDAQLDMQAERSRNIDKLAKQDEENFGYAKADVARRADEMSIPYFEKREKQLAYDLRQIYEREDPSRIESLESVKKGTPLTMERARFLDDNFGEDAEEVARNLGYSIYGPEIYDEDLR